MDSWPLKPSKDTPTRVKVHNPERLSQEGPLKTVGLEREIQRISRENIPQTRITYGVRSYEYQAPFHYPNVNCELGREGTGTGAHPEGMELDIPPFGAVTIEEKEPIIGVTVMGSFCIAPGTILVFGEPLEWKYARAGVKYKQTNLWGEHLYGWGANDRHSEGNRHTGLLSANFDIVDCSKVTIMGYGPIDVHVSFPGKSPGTAGETMNDWWNDAHFNILGVRVTVRLPEG